MKCADTGFMQSFLDGECGLQESERFIAHLETCTECSEQLEALSALDSWTRGTLKQQLFRPTDQVKVNTEAAWQTFSQRIGQHTSFVSQNRTANQEHVAKRSWKDMNQKTKRWVTGSSVAAVLVVSLSFPQVQAAASDFLSIFRMDKVEFVKVTQDDLAQVEGWLNSGKAGEMELAGIGKLWIDEADQGKIDKGEHNKYYNSRESAEKAGVKLPAIPSDMTFEGVDVSTPYTIHFEMNVEKANKLLAQLKVENRFDENLSGKRFSLHVANMQNIWMKNDKDSISYSVVSAPELQAPDGVDMGQLRDTMLSLPFIPNNVKKQMLSIDDWQHTLPLPYLEDGDSKMKEVKVHGQAGVLITNSYHKQLIWQENGQIHTLGGSNSTEEELLTLAKNLK
ncbi:anti-sigma factor family protein [Brevibacillus sp. SIMBA_040]|uniref:anti-sigma factor family protein n=1 Tax=unclassified Brevibacillus TaxID=2684853 RepID=UPI00397BAD77